MLNSWNFGDITKTLGARARAAAGIEANPELVPEPTLRHHTLTIAPKRRRHLEPAPRQRSAKEHAQALLDWIYTNVDLSEGPITHAAILEFYTELLIEQDWTPRPWNPVAHQFRLLTTGNRKVYAWITTTTGALHRLRVYPIPVRASDAASTPATKSKAVGSLSSSKLRRVA
jgi:hypothetical protein